MRWVVNAMPWPLCPQEWPGTHCTGGWVGPKAGVDRCWKSRPNGGFDPRTAQPTASRYTDYTILAHKNLLSLTGIEPLISRSSTPYPNHYTDRGTVTSLSHLRRLHRMPMYARCFTSTKSLLSLHSVTPGNKLSCIDSTSSQRVQSVTD
jgi:hypothetical protein